MRLLINLIISVLSIVIAAKIVPGISINSWETAVIVAILLGTLNTFIKPILLLLTLPITILTLGLFALIINVAIIMFVGEVVAGFTVSSFLSALLFGIVVSLVSSFLSMFSK